MCAFLWFVVSWCATFAAEKVTVKDRAPRKRIQVGIN